MSTVSVAHTATLVHGYTMARIDRLSHDAATRARWVASLLDPVDAREEAWRGIIELLFSERERPTEWMLIQAGSLAIAERVNVDLRDRGLRQVKGGTGYEDAPRFNSYWTHIVGARPDWTDAIIERMALPNALSILTPDQYEAVITLAAFMRHDEETEGTTVASPLSRTADRLGLSYAATKHLLNRARKRMREVWFEHETPAGERTWDNDVECRYGHSRAEHGRRTTKGGWACRTCARNAARRAQARGDGQVVLEDLPPDEPVKARAMVAVPSSGEEPVGARHQLAGHGRAVIGSTACWCGLEVGHDWPHKEQGAPHPTAA